MYIDRTFTQLKENVQSSHANIAPTVHLKTNAVLIQLHRFPLRVQINGWSRPNIAINKSPTS